MSKTHTDICYSGPPRMTASGREVLAFHLHRFLAVWLQRHGVNRVLVTVGYEDSAAEAVTFETSMARCESVEVGWTFADLVQAYRWGDGRLHFEQRGSGPIVFELFPIVDQPATGGEARVILGFVLLPSSQMVAQPALDDLTAEAYEAITSARRNAVRLFFDEKKALPIKPLIYALMSHLPEWTGCDFSAAMLVTSTLETMTLESSEGGRFDVLAERMFDDEQPRDRLVGLSIQLGQDSAGLVSHAVERQRQDPELPYQVFTRDPNDPKAWIAVEDPDHQHAGFHRIDEERREQMYVLVPLLNHAAEDVELLGFACLTYTARGELASTAGHNLSQIAQHLTAILRHSPLYTLNARKLWILEQMRQALEDAMALDQPAVARVEGFIGQVTELLEAHVDVPSVSVAYLRWEDEERRRHLRYVHPFGWTHFDQLDLPVDVDPDERPDSGVSALALRINRPLVLAGGHGEGESLAFKNFLYVNEATGEVLDSRSPAGRRIDAGEGWERLRDYYKPARQSSYATLAYPVSFGGQPLGMLSIEVERDTNWLWWTGFGGRLFWEMLARELAYAFQALGVADEI